MFNYRVLAALLCACIAGPANADMESLVKELRSEPMTMFDWGLFLLEEELQSVRRKEHDFLRVTYDKTRQRIVVDAVFLIDKEEVAAVTADRACYTRHHAIKLTFGIIDTDKIHIAPASNFRLGSKFSHHNSDDYAELPDAGKIGAELLESVYIKVGVASDVDQFPFDLLARCEGRALSQRVIYNGAGAGETNPLLE